MSATRLSSGLTPGRRRTANKENLYFEPGKGRKTGVTLPDTGIRDEHGFEPVSGIFNTPMVRTPARHSLPEPLPAPSTTRSGRMTKSPLKFRSPQKTHIGGSAVRRSPYKSFPEAAAESAAEEAPTRLLESDESPQRSASRSLRPRKSLFAVESPITKVTRRRSPSIDIDRTIDEVTRSLQDSDPLVPDARNPSVYPEPSHNSPVPYSADLSYNGGQEPDQTVLLAFDDAPMQSGKRKRSYGVAQTAVMQTPSPARSNANGSSSRKRGRSSRSSVAEAPHHSSPGESVHQPTEQTFYEQPADQTIDEQPADQTIDEQPLEQTVDEQRIDQTTDEQPTEQPFQDTADFSQEIYDTTEIDHDNHGTVVTFEEDDHADRQTPRKRNRRAQVATARRSHTRPHGRPQDDDSDYSRSEPRGNTARTSVRMRSVTPFEDATNVTRSGRVVHKPYQYWKNERPVWENGRMTGVIRAEDVPEAKRKVNRRRTNTRTRLNMDNVEETIPDDLLPESWESETKVIRGPVKFWNADLGRTDGTNVVEDVGFSHHALNYSDAQKGEFKHAKIVRVPFFGAGLLEIPPNGHKGARSARNMQMIFFVHEGKVTADVADMTFGITAGGTFLVPRGNTYSITNESDKYTAKIFFSQACEPELVES